MRLLTNLSWPEQPYAAGHRPFGQTPTLLTAVALLHLEQGLPAAAGCVHLRVSARDRLDLDPARFTFGFRAYRSDHDPRPFVEAVDGDLNRARSHAAYLVGHGLSDDLAALRRLAAGLPTPGISRAARVWEDRTAAEPGRARAHDTRDDGGAHDLLRASKEAHIDVDLTVLTDESDVLAAVLRRGLTVALLAARTLETLHWSNDVDVDALIAADAWDLFTDLPDRTPAPTAATRPSA